jgi:hypothetical protein
MAVDPNVGWRHLDQPRIRIHVLRYTAGDTCIRKAKTEDFCDFN